MDSLLLLCARCVVAHHPLPALPDDLYPILFKAAFLDRRPLVLQDLVAAWPFTELHFQRLVGHQKLLRDYICIDGVKAVIQAVVSQVKRELEDPSCDFSLRVLDLTELPDSGLTIWFSTLAWAKACMEVSKHREEFQRRGSKRHKGCSGAATAVTPPQPPGVDVHTDLCFDRTSYKKLRHVLQAGATGPLRLKCREFQAEDMSASEIVTLLESLDPSCVRRVDLCYNNLALTGLSVILPCLLRFPELRSLKVEVEARSLLDLTPELATRISVARQLGMLPCLRELKLGSSQLSGNLRQILGDLQAPLESLEMDCCSLIPDDLAFLSQSFHAPALKKLHLRGLNFYEGLLEPLRLLLEKTSASLLHLDLMECRMDNSHLHALLPTLLRCSRLRVLGLYDNPLSTAALKDLLQKTLELPNLHQVVYPCPRDCYKHPMPENDWDSGLDEELFAMAKEEFSEMLANSGRTDLVWTDNPDDHRDLDYFSL